jgi:hypothetical protein
MARCLQPLKAVWPGRQAAAITRSTAKRYWSDWTATTPLQSGAANNPALDLHLDMTLNCVREQGSRRIVGSNDQNLWMALGLVT